MKKALLNIITMIFCLEALGQVTTLSGDYKIINIGGNGYGDYTRSLILLHQIYNGTLIDHNYAIGTITAMRGNSGSFNRMNVANVNTSSAYNMTTGMLYSFDDFTFWQLKICTYNGTLYIAVDVPYTAGYHNLGYQFSGWTSSSGESMKCVSYQVNGQPVNQNILSNIQDYQPNMSETHNAATFVISGNVGIGTTSPVEKLAVNGTIHAKQVRVDVNGWPDYVFKKDYKLPQLKTVKSYIDNNHHLPELPSAEQVERDGQNLGEMNKLLLKKVEELTLYLIIENKKNANQQNRIEQLEKRRSRFSKR